MGEERTHAFAMLFTVKISVTQVDESCGISIAGGPWAHI